jgi:hypothetical protein
MAGHHSLQQRLSMCTYSVFKLLLRLCGCVLRAITHRHHSHFHWLCHPPLLPAVRRFTRRRYRDWREFVSYIGTTPCPMMALPAIL